MKLVIGLFLASYAIAADLSSDQVTCLPSGSGITVQLNLDVFRKYRGPDLRLGTCPFDLTRRVEAGSSCGLIQTVTMNTISFAGVINSVKPTAMITRKRPVSIAVSCSYDTRSRKTADAHIAPTLQEITGMLTSIGGPVDLFLNLLDDVGKTVGSGDVLSVEVGSKVSATIGGAEGLGLNVYATDCFATPTAQDYSIKYPLLSDSCVKDETFSVTSDGNGQLLTFDSFAFTHDTNSNVYLHCDLLACPPGAQCGQCHQPIRRRKRAAAAAATMKIMKRVDAAMHVRM